MRGGNATRSGEGTDGEEGPPCIHYYFVASVSQSFTDRTPWVLASMLITAVFIGVKLTAVRGSFDPFS
jgi:hypothetical protein